MTKCIYFPHDIYSDRFGEAIQVGRYGIPIHLLLNEYPLCSNRLSPWNEEAHWARACLNG